MEREIINKNYNSSKYEVVLENLITDLADEKGVKVKEVIKTGYNGVCSKKLIKYLVKLDGEDKGISDYFKKLKSTIPSTVVMLKRSEEGYRRINIYVYYDLYDKFEFEELLEEMDCVVNRYENKTGIRPFGEEVKEHFLKDAPSGDIEIVKF